jgi:hypothetical protein
VHDNGWEDISGTFRIWHQGDIQKWASSYFGLDKVWDLWTVSGQNPSVYYFMREEDLVIFTLKFPAAHGWQC